MTRPTEYSQALGAVIASRIANDERLAMVCLDAELPDVITVSKWLYGGQHRDFEDMLCWAQERRDVHTYAEEKWGPYPRTMVSPSDVSILMEHFVMKPAASRQFQYVDEGADLEREIRTRRFRLTIVPGGGRRYAPRSDGSDTSRARDVSRGVAGDMQRVGGRA